MAKPAKLPPQNQEAEQSVLGSLLIDKNAIIQVGDVLAPEYFYHPQNGIIYETVMRLFKKRQPIDIMTVSNDLKEKGSLKDVGGSTYLSKLVDSVPSATNVGYYAKLV